MRLKERKRKKAVSGVRTQDQYSDKIKANSFTFFAMEAVEFVGTCLSSFSLSISLWNYSFLQQIFPYKYISLIQIEMKKLTCL